MTRPPESPTTMTPASERDRARAEAFRRDAQGREGTESEMMEFIAQAFADHAAEAVREERDRIRAIIVLRSDQFTRAGNSNDLDGDKVTAAKHWAIADTLDRVRREITTAPTPPTHEADHGK